MERNFYDKVVVKIAYQGFRGSGVLISDEEKNNSYLISAWHCFGKQSNIDYQKIEIFRQEDNSLKQLFLDFKDQIISEPSDIVIFLVNYKADIPQYQVLYPKMKRKIVFVGFPNGLSGEDAMTHRYRMSGEINDIPNDSIIQINMDRNPETYSQDAIGNMSSYSGSGVFVESDKSIYLCGIITELGSKEGVFAFVNGISISRIDDILYQEKIVHLPNVKWTSFEKFEESTLEIFEGSLVDICSVQIPEIIKNVTPNSILEHCGNKIVWPYSDKSLLKQEVWEEWLLYLIIRSIESRDNVKNEEFYVIKKEEKNRKVKVIYDTDHTTLPEFLKDYLVRAYQDISVGQVMIVQTDKPPAIKKISTDSIEKIVSDISSTVGKTNHVYIDTVGNNIRQMSIMHISALIDEMVKVTEENKELRGTELEKKLGERMFEVIYGN